jgi:hypothetical protein
LDIIGFLILGIKNGFSTMSTLDEQIKIYLQKIETNSVKESWVENNLNILWEYLKSKEGYSFSEKLYIYINHKHKCYCGKETKFLSFKRGYRKYCSKKCSNSDQNLINKKKEEYKKSNIERYGVDNTSKLDSVRNKIKESKKNLDYDTINDKIRNTLLEKYGVDNISKLDFIKEKKKKIFLEKYGVDNISKLDFIKEKIKKTNYLKYGHESPSKSDFIKEKKKKIFLEKYGFDNPMKSEKVREKFKESCKENWGEEHFSKSEEYKKLNIDKLILKLNRLSDNIEILSLEDKEYNIKCRKCNSIFNISVNYFNIRKNINVNICTKCNPVKKNQSISEIEIFNFLKENTNLEIFNNYKIDGTEIDLFIPDLNIAIEFNGVYWHSELKRPNDYHINKFRKMLDNNINLIQIWEDDWNNKKNIIKSMLKNKLGKSKRIYGRKCEIKKVTSKDSKKFLNDNHIQGWCVSKLRYGLYFENELVSLMTFGKKRLNLGNKKSNKNEWELLRFCNKTNISVIGGASKLFKHFLKNVDFDNIISYSKNDYSDGGLYNKLGFVQDKMTDPNYYWVVNSIRENRFKYRKDKLVSMGYDKNKTAVQIMQENGYYRVFDSGNRKWIFNRN